MRSGCRGFECRSGHLIFSSICSVYIDTLGISELTSLMMNNLFEICHQMLHTLCMVYNIWSDELSSL